jgi:hypothetical protein
MGENKVGRRRSRFEAENISYGRTAAGADFRREPLLGKWI